ncbi:MAG: hypothetical protein HGA35_03785 [Erysipelotrichaceae bacterium]|nr:hypothetical protein [Erysipelotrichaceae bacterium]
MQHAPLHLKISHAQVLKARRGFPIQISADSIGHPQGCPFTNLHPLTHKKLMDAKRLRKGARVMLSESELEGSGIKEFFGKVKNFFVKNKEFIKPLASAAMDLGAQLYPQAQPLRQTIKAKTGWGEMVQTESGFPSTPVVKKTPKRKTGAKRSTKKSACSKGAGMIPAGYSGY